MKGSTTQIIVFIIAVCVARYVYADLMARQDKLAPTRGLVSSMPIAGFQKFASDVEWMRFIQYCGGIRSVDEDNAAEIEKRINRIIGLDPDFERIYYEGALILSAKAPDRALKILDKGIDHPKFKRNWKLPLLAGMIIMRPEMDKYYRKQEMDLGQVERARGYFERAAKCPGRAEYVTNSLVRAEAALKKSDQPAEIVELEVWYDYWEKSQGAMGGDLGNMDVFGGESSEYGFGVDLRKRLLDSLRRAKKAHPESAYLQDKSTKIFATVFPEMRVDPETFVPYGPGVRFSPITGKKLEVYGICKNPAQDKLNPIVLRGRFCHTCGYDNGEEIKPKKAPMAVPPGTPMPDAPPAEGSHKK